MTKFDKGALLRWDALVRDQQARLEQVSILMRQHRTAKIDQRLAVARRPLFLRSQEHGSCSSRTAAARHGYPVHLAQRRLA